MKSIKVHSKWCTQQQNDYKLMLECVDNLGAAAVGLSSGGAQSYQQFTQARQDLKNLFKEIGKNYRYVTEE